MVSELGDDESAAPGHRLADAHRKIVGLASRTGEYHAAGLRQQCRQQLFGELQRLLGEITRVSVEHARLAGERFDYLRVAVADDGHIVIRIQITPTFLVVHPYALGAHDLQRLLVEQLIGRCQHACAARLQIAAELSLGASSL